MEVSLRDKPGDVPCVESRPHAGGLITRLSSWHFELESKRVTTIFDFDGSQGPSLTSLNDVNSRCETGKS